VRRKRARVKENGRGNGKEARERRGAHDFIDIRGRDKG